MRRFSFFAAVFLLFILSTSSMAQVIWRSGKTIKKNSFIAMSSLVYKDFTKGYDWNSEEWKDFGDGRGKNATVLNTMFGYGISDRWEAMIHLPFSFLSDELAGVENTSSGLSDLYLKTRYGVIPWSKEKKHGMVIIGTIRLATGDDKANPALGDGSTDFALGTIYTKAITPRIIGHAKANYWLNGKNDNDFNIGNELKLIGAIGYKITNKIQPRLVLSYYNKSKMTDADDNTIDNSQLKRYDLVIDAVIQATEKLVIRPRILLPLGGEGGANTSITPIIDLWYVFKLN